MENKLYFLGEGPLSFKNAKIFVPLSVHVPYCVMQEMFEGNKKTQDKQKSFKTHFEWWVLGPLSIKYERIVLLF